MKYLDERSRERESESERVREEMRKKLIALQEMYGVTTAETSRFLLGQRTCVARRWLLGWCCHAWMLFPAML